MVRIWCVPVECLDRQHLLGEHVELHTIFNVILYNKKGYSNHPQTNRFRGHLGQLICRHAQQVKEMRRRGYNHKSPLPELDVVSEEYAYANEELESDFKTLELRSGINKFV